MAKKLIKETVVEPVVEPIVEPVKDDFDAFEVPPHTKPKTGEAFDHIKRLAREKIQAAEKRAEDSEAKTKELESKATDPLTPELKAELEELRTFRKRLDVESDPEFTSFDKKSSSNDEAIYAKLLQNGATKETVQKIKDLGGPTQIDWEPILNRLPSVVRRSVESKLVENEEIVEKKAAAIADAKKNADEFLKSRATQTEGLKKSQQERAVKTLNGLRPSFDWLTAKTAGAKATAAEKAGVQEHNALVKESEDYLAEAMSDDSPEMRATIAMAGPELFRARYELKTYRKGAEVQIKKLSEDLKAANTLLDKVKNGSTTRLRNSTAETGGKIPLNETPEEALDRLAKEATEGTED